jgi:hypothetical protein
MTPLSPRQSFNVACAIQLDRIKAHLHQQTIRIAAPVCVQSVYPTRRYVSLGTGDSPAVRRRRLVRRAELRLLERMMES